MGEKPTKEESDDKLTRWYNSKVAARLANKRHPYAVDYETRKKCAKYGILV